MWPYNTVFTVWLWIFHSSPNHCSFLTGTSHNGWNINRHNQRNSHHCPIHSGCHVNTWSHLRWHDLQQPLYCNSSSTSLLSDVSLQQSSVTSGEFHTSETTPTTNEQSEGSAEPDAPTTAATMTVKGGCDSLSWSCSRRLLLVTSVLLFEAQSI